MPSIFYSWQSDAPSNLCRNFIQKALESAIDRLRADMDVEPALRDALELDHDTKGVPGSPDIFDTIREKIAGCAVFVADLTFVGSLLGGEPVSNPNVLIEYGLALTSRGEHRILAVMNESFGTTNEKDMPFNLRHKRFPIRYSLGESATEDERRSARKSLVSRFEVALKTILSSPSYANELEARRPSAAMRAAQKRAKWDHNTEIANLSTGDGPSRVRKQVLSLLSLIEGITKGIESEHELGLSAGFDASALRGVVKTQQFGIVVRLEQQQIGLSVSELRLAVETYKGRLYLPGAFQGGVHIRQPEMISQRSYRPTLSRQLTIGWVISGSEHSDSEFVTTETLADEFVAEVVTLLT